MFLTDVDSIAVIGSKMVEKSGSRTNVSLLDVIGTTSTFVDVVIDRKVSVRLVLGRKRKI